MRNTFAVQISRVFNSRALHAAVAAAALVRPHTIVMLGIATVLIAHNNGVLLRRAIPSALAITFALAAGFAFNDLTDRAADAVNAPWRPLVACHVSERNAWRTVLVSLGAAMTFAAAAGSSFIAILTIGLVVSAWLYSTAIKRVLALKNLFVGAWCGILPWSASLDYRPLDQAALAGIVLVAIFITQKELIADIYDRDGDAATGVATLATTGGPAFVLGIIVLLNALLFAAADAARTALPPAFTLCVRGLATFNMITATLAARTPTQASIKAYLGVQKGMLLAGCILLALSTAR